MPGAVILDALRTPNGNLNEALASIRLDDVTTLVLGELFESTAINPELIDKVILGCANQAG